MASELCAQERKAQLIDDVMIGLGGTYTPDSVVYHNVRKGLGKFSENELHSIWAMLISNRG